MDEPPEVLEIEPLAELDVSLVGGTGDEQVVEVEAEQPKRDQVGVLESIQSLNRIRDIDTLLEQVLLKARQLVRADAGTLYLTEKNRLFFSYVQNDTLFTSQRPESRYVYSAKSLAISRASLAGYVATTREPLVIDDVYDIQSGVSYAFNPEFDAKSSYRTKSMLIVPLLTRDAALVGVLQLINAKNGKGESVPFSYQDRLFAAQFAQHAADAVERAKLTRDMVLGMVALSAFRDPFETADHANRVGAYAYELYNRWAPKQGYEPLTIRAAREMIRTAAMLHDVGKAAISDTILRKGSNLTPEEHAKMRLHTIYGARLFKRDEAPWHVMARTIALNHHERWDGAGYPGHLSSIFKPRIRVGRPKREKEIPVEARIVAIADVFDALSSKRAHKEAWSEEEVFSRIEAESGAHFDPELVELFLGMKDVVHSIRRKYA